MVSFEGVLHALIVFQKRKDTKTTDKADPAAAQVVVAKPVAISGWLLPTLSSDSDDSLPNSEKVEPKKTKRASRVSK